jgi:hypothetical protein
MAHQSAPERLAGVPQEVGRARHRRWVEGSEAIGGLFYSIE